jgi:hypothetical protein
MSDDDTVTAYPMPEGMALKSRLDRLKDELKKCGIKVPKAAEGALESFLDDVYEEGSDYESTDRWD